MDDCIIDSLQTTAGQSYRTKAAALASSNDEAKSKISLTQHVVYTVARKMTAGAYAECDALETNE